MNTTEEPPAQELELAPQSAPAIETMKRANPEAAFEDFSQEITPILEQSKALTIADADKLAIVKVADEYRKDVKKLRCAVEARRKELVADLNKQTKDINGAAGKLWDICEKEEARLLEIVEHAEREATRIQAEKRTARTAEIAPFLSSVPAVDLGTLTDEQYAGMLTDAKDAHAARLAREKAEKEAAAAKLKAEAEERERIRLENERLKKEAEEREAAAKKEREAAAAALAKEREEAAKLAREAKEKADAEAAKIKAEAEAAAVKERDRVAAEQAAAAAKAKKEREEIEAKAKKEREAAEAKAKAEREAREKAERELAQIENERQKAVAAEREAAARKAAEAEAAALAPEKDKLKAFAATVRALIVPTLGTEKGIKVADEVAAKVESFANWIAKQAAAL